MHNEKVNGIDIDAQTRCAHYQTDVDIIAIKFRCCRQWFPCYECHRESAGHEAQIWPGAEMDERAILCGACGYKLSIAEYIGCESTCPVCKAKFNPGCARHFHLYFATQDTVNFPKRTVAA